MMIDNSLQETVLKVPDDIIDDVLGHDIFWGGMLKNSQNMLGKIWIMIRDDLRSENQNRKRKSW